MTKPADYVNIFSTPAIILRRIEYGDYDYILTFMTPSHGKISAIAKNAKKSVKRFSGVLELFYSLDIVVREGRKLSFLEEASIEESFPGIRSDIIKTAYASFWNEVIVQWLEEGVLQKKVYDLLEYALTELDLGNRSPEEISIIFQMKFLDIVGFTPELKNCGECDTDIEDIEKTRLVFDIKNGWLLCDNCKRILEKRRPVQLVPLSKGTVKQLLWLQNNDAEKLKRIKMSGNATYEGLRLLESFLPFHLEKELRSLKFLKKIRRKDL